MKPLEPNFTGDVSVTGYFTRPSPSRLAGATVTFAPGARTPWKTTPLGQTLIVTNGRGWAQVDGGSVVEVAPGDLIWRAPGRRHWEGATPDHGMTYVAMQELDGGRGVAFGEAVTEAEYRRDLG